MNGYPNYNFHGCPTSGFNCGFPNPDGSYGDPQNMHFTHNQNATFNFYIGNGPSAPPPPPSATSQTSPLFSHSPTPSYQAGRAPMNAMDLERSWYLNLDPQCHPHYHFPMGRVNVHPGRDPHPNSHRCLNSRGQQDIVFVMAPEQQGENCGHQSFNPNQVPLPQQPSGTTQHHGGSFCPQFNGARLNHVANEYGGNRPTYAFRVNPRFTNSNISSGASSPFQSLQSSTTPPPQATDELLIEELSQRSLQNSQSQRSFSNSQN